MNRRQQAGLSLIELMVALLLSGLLILGLVQIFSSSRASYLMAQGLARAQESSRFAIDALQRDARMSGHFGCVSDQGHFFAGNGLFGELFLSDRNDYGSIPAANEALRFDYSIRGYEANGTAPASTLNLTTAAVPGSAGDWSPNLPAAFVNTLKPTPIRGSDILMLRFLSPESAEVKKFSVVPSGSIEVDSDQWKRVAGSEAPTENPGLFGIADCRSVVMFQAKSVTTAGAVTKLAVAQSGVNKSAFDGSDTFASGQARVYRAESFVYYVGINPTSKEPTLYRARYTAAPDVGAVSLDTGASEELVEGVENMQLLFAQDTVTDPAQPPTGVINGVRTAAGVLPDSASQGGWQRVGGMQVGLLIRSTERATATPRANSPRSLGTTLTLPNDGRYRSVYETNIALRNRLFGN
ncbi:PilW family protein [Lysobacter sp. K5869]|uniref:PilW family protein n=1 Tax=Lysobacter sp. K5869 TaxID=2820808 RepID=UPI001C06236F|nr:PilW family protein [Lysobacter sp. K5869]QWP79056.1 PilW family protein [Lysobacter sp. K5869]